MTRAPARALVGAAALAATFGAARPSAAEPAALTTPVAVAVAPTAAGLSETYPLVFLFQGDAVVDSAPSAAGTATGGEPGAGSHLRVRRLRVGEDWWRGTFGARVLLEASSRDESFVPVDGGRIANTDFVRLTEAFVAWRPHRAVELDAGAQRVPFSLSRQVNEPDLRFPERAQVVVALAPDYRTGVAFTSDLGAMNLRIAGMSADRFIDEHVLTSGFFGAARLGADPIGPMGVAPWRRRPDDPWYGWWRFSAGVSVLYGTLLAPRTLGFGGDAQLQWRRVTITGEYLAQHLAGSTVPLPSQGAVLEPGVFLISARLELVLRGAWYRQPAPPLALPGSTDTMAAGGALTFFARDGHLRVQAGLELRHTLDARLADSDWAIIRATLLL
jgi:phosphate-selective porin O/P